MQLIAPTDSRLSRPFRIADGSSQLGPRLGGLAPAFPVAPELHQAAEYILTFPLCTQPDLYASVFRNCPWEEFFAALNDGFMSDPRIVTFVHPDLPRGTSGNHASALSPHPVLILPPESDLFDDGEGGFVVTSDHKFGGRPYFIQESQFKAADELFDLGYSQILQVDFPGSEDARITGPWPFGDGLFNLFWRLPFLGSELRWCIQK